MHAQPYYIDGDIRLASPLTSVSFLADTTADLPTDTVETVIVNPPDEEFGFLHEAAIIEFGGALYASWYNCPAHELNGYTPICERRSAYTRRASVRRRPAGHGLAACEDHEKRRSAGRERAGPSGDLRDREQGCAVVVLPGRRAAGTAGVPLRRRRGDMERTHGA